MADPEKCDSRANAIIDISEPLAPATAVFPGDTRFSQEWVMRLDQDHSCNVSTIRHSVHCGTHADAPLHYLPDGCDIGSVALDAYLGSCRVLDVTSVAGSNAEKTVNPECLKADRLRGIERVLLRTIPPSRGHDHTVFDPGFTALGPDAAKQLASCGIRLVGLDTPSIDHPTSQDLPGHKVLAAAGIAILENLDLSRVPVGGEGHGDFELIALPIRIEGADAAPVRAVLRPLQR